MEKSMLYTGIAYAAAGLACMLVALATEFPIEPLLWGLFGGGLGGGLRMIWEYCHWSSPEHREEYAERIKQETIELRDERKVMLRYRSGWAGYMVMTGLYFLLIMVFAVLNMLGYFAAVSRFATLGLAGLLVIQLLLGHLAYRHYEKQM